MRVFVDLEMVPVRRGWRAAAPHIFAPSLLLLIVDRQLAL